MYNIHCTCTLKFKQPVVESDGGRYEKDDGEDEIVNERELGDWSARTHLHLRNTVHKFLLSVSF